MSEGETANETHAPLNTRSGGNNAVSSVCARRCRCYFLPVQVTACNTADVWARLIFELYDEFRSFSSGVYFEQRKTHILHDVEHLGDKKRFKKVSRTLGFAVMFYISIEDSCSKLQTV